MGSGGALTPLGQLSFFIDFLKQPGLFEQLMRDAPLRHTSLIAPPPRDLLETLGVAGTWRTCWTNRTTIGAGAGS